MSNSTRVPFVILSVVVGAIVYWAFGYAFAYGVVEDDPYNINSFIGYRYFFTLKIPSGDLSSWFFQFVFAATAATIVSGGIVERTKFSAYIFYSLYITGFVYPVLSHWTWSNGWLTKSPFKNVQYLDFAGATVVHVCGLGKQYFIT